ncbi:proteasome accessory factor PafA2 family protein [Micropruina sp.]|uniref:proteasome accessory factor PafA2 family protein n=1 Tax=Micropruina sp. TaxID=2737536 RepID=UPI0039E4396E
MSPSAQARRVIGVETEYGLVGRGTDRGNRLSGGEAAQWLFNPIEREHASSNVFLRNGGRLYLDVGSHPEYATAECTGVPDLLLHERAGDELLARLCRRAEADAAAEGQPVELRLFKNNVDSHGNSYGCHENYLIARALDLPALAAALTPFLVTRQVLCGTGRWSPDGFSISQRAEVLHDELSSMTTRSRPLINTRDEPLADPRRFRRLHVIAGDSNLSEPSAALKVGSLLAVLGAIEHALATGGALPALELDDVAGALRAVARDPRTVLRLASGRTIGALDVQAEYLALAGAVPVAAPWQRVLTALGGDHEDDLDGEVEWVTKRALLRRYADSRGLAWHDRRLAQVDLAFHEITSDESGRPRGLFRLLEARGAAVRLTTAEAVEQALLRPPSDTRAALRGRLIRTAQAEQRRYSVDWSQFTAFDLPQPDGTRDDRTVRLTDPLVVADQAVDELQRALSSGWSAPNHP